MSSWVWNLDRKVGRSIGCALVLLSMLACSDVGNQSGDGGQVASASAIGLGTDGNGTFFARSGSEVILSGKDSDSAAAPLFEYDWRQTAGPAVVLFERNVTNRSFTFPDMAGTLEFELTVTDVNGRTAVDTVTIEAEQRIADTNDFLRNPTVVEDFYLFVAPDVAGVVASTTSYTLAVRPFVNYVDRVGTTRRQGLNVFFSVSDEISAGFNAPLDPVGASQKRHVVAVPLLDFDDVNQFFQGALRDGRLEPEQIDAARVELEISLTGVSGSADLEVFVASSSSPTAPIAGRCLSFDPGSETGASTCDLTLDPTRGPILDESETIVSLSLEAIRQWLEIESKESARNYYACIDPDDDSSTLDGWLKQAGFLDPANAGSIVNAKYLNNYDLGFGRDMFLRTDTDGNVYSYVVNYPGLETLLNGQGDFATVVMEYSAAPTGFCGPDPATFNEDEKIVKFYAYSPSSLTGEVVRTFSQNFDGRGERFMPGVCTACHAGDLNQIAAFSPIDVTTGAEHPIGSIPATSADLDATFMPWDIETMLFSRAEGRPDLVDPSVNQSEFTSAQLDSASLGAQHDAFRALNEATLITLVGNGDNIAELNRVEAPLQLIHGWYGDENITIGTSPSEISDLLDLESDEFNPLYIQAGWDVEPILYREVYARYCRLCHTQLSDLDKNFDTYAEFIGNQSRLENRVFDRGLMPISRLTFDRFWVDFDGDSMSAAEILAAHINTLPGGPTVPPERLPGAPHAQISATDSSGQAINNPIRDVDANGDLLSTAITLLGDDSLFADSFAWAVTTLGSGCPPSPNLSGASSQQALLIVDSSPCTFTTTLDVTSGGTAAQDSVQFVTDRFPSAVDFTASTVGYTPGDAFLDIDVLINITSDIDGDGSPLLVINDPNSPYFLAVNNSVVDLGGGVASISFPALAGTTDSFQYQVEDLNGSIASAFGTVDVVIDPIVPVLTATPGSLTETAVTIEWSVPAGFVADSYTVERDSNPIANTNALSFSDTTLQSGVSYVFSVIANLGAEQSPSNDLMIATTVGVPSGLMATVTTSSVSLSWTAGVGTAPTGYSVYRDGGLIGTTSGAGATSFFDSGRAQNTTYQYEVSQTTNGVESSRSTPFGATTDTAPVSSIAASPVFNTSDQINLTWSAPAGGTSPSFYRIFSGGSLIATTALTSVTFSSITSNTFVSYEVAGVGTNGESSRMSASATTNPSLTDTITASGLSNATTNAGSYPAGCLTSGCHGGESSAALRSRFLNPCLTNDTDIGDCSISMSGIFIGTSFRNLLIDWNDGGSPN